MLRKIRIIVLFLILTSLLLFYPGDSYYYHIFAYDKSHFLPIHGITQTSINNIPVVSNNSLPIVSAEGIFIADLTTFTPLFEKNINNKFYPASTTKIITALVATDIYKLNHIITIKHSFNEGQVMGLIAGEKISVENLLYGLLVYSGNDAAMALAEEYGIDAFVIKMNEKAQQIHMKNSTFRNPSGLDDPAQMTTPKDLALAGRELLLTSSLKHIVGTKEIVISDENYQYFHRLVNVNKLLGEFPGIGGLKTGYTELAGENLVTFYKKNGREYVIVILKSLDRFADTRNVVDWINQNISFID
ncbi:MAG: serine hydrolase [Candidatus Roizmanbacteria bacterium]